MIRASSESTQDSLEVTVVGLRPREVRIVDAMVTQGVQPLDPVNSIPLVRSKKAVVNVLVEMHARVRLPGCGDIASVRG
jgi:hypothetical protein